MADYELSKKANEDLNEIYLFSHRRFGEAKADGYLLALQERFSLLAANPLSGRPIDHIRKGYFRYQHASRAILHRLSANGIIVIRVLHQRMDIRRHIG